MTVTLQTLQEYTDLTAARLDALRLARERAAGEINRAMWGALAHLINGDGALTTEGAAVLARAERILAGELPPSLGAGWVENAAAAAAFLRRWRGFGWARSAHIKAMRSLYRSPGQAWGWMHMAYGYEVLDELMSRGLIRGEKRLGSALELTALGVQMLRMALAYDEELRR